MRFSETTSSSVKWRGIYFDDSLDIKQSVRRALTPKPFRQRLLDRLSEDSQTLIKEARKRQEGKDKNYKPGQTSVSVFWGLVKSAAHQIYHEAKQSGSH